MLDVIITADRHRLTYLDQNHVKKDDREFGNFLGLGVQRYAVIPQALLNLVNRGFKREVARCDEG